MNKERFAERMLETENLTDALEDADANWLLNWGTEKLDTALSGVQDDDAAGERANALMAVMRKMNRIAGSSSEKSPEDLAADLASLRELAAAAFPQTTAAAEAVPVAATRSRGLSIEDAAVKPPAANDQPEGKPTQGAPQRIRPAETGFRPWNSVVNWFRRWQQPAVEQPAVEQPAPKAQAVEPLKAETAPAAEEPPAVVEQPAAASQPDLNAEAARLAQMSPRDVLKELSKLIGE